MANILYPPARPQSVGEILDSAFRIFRAALLKCLPYATIAVLAGQSANLYSLLSGHSIVVPLLQQRDPIWWLLYVLGILIAGVFFGSAILLRQYALATGHAASLAEELGTTARRFPGMLLLILLVALAMSVSLAPLRLASVAHGWTRLALMAILLLPASCIALALSQAWPVLLLTGKSALASMVHSSRLTWGSWWRLTLIYTVAIVLLVVIYTLASIIAGIVSLVFAHGDLAMITATATVLIVLLGAVITPFYYALVLAVLGDLSVRREGADLEQRIATPATP